MVGKGKLGLDRELAGFWLGGLFAKTALPSVKAGEQGGEWINTNLQWDV